MKILKTFLGWIGAVAVLLMLVAAFFPILIPMAVAQGVGTTLFLTSGGGSTGAFGRPIPIPAYLLSKNIATNTTTAVKASPGVLGCIIVNTGASSTTATVYNNSYAESGSKMATLSTASPGLFCYGAIFSNALTIVTSGAADITVTYR